MRKDPPFDSEYFYATHLLEQAEREGARVFNKPASLRDHPEKLAIMEFPQFASPTLVTRDAEDVKRFHAEHQEIILKPLDGMGGMGIFRVGADGLNLGSIIETLNHHGTTTIMVQTLRARDRARRQAGAGDRRQAGALQPGAHPAGQRDPRQPRRRRQGRGAAAVGARPRDRQRAGPGARRARPAAGGTGRDRRLPDRNQRHQPDLLPGDPRSRPASTCRRCSSMRWKRRCAASALAGRRLRQPDCRQAAVRRPQARYPAACPSTNTLQFAGLEGDPVSRWWSAAR